jgi:hypothetical protein
MVRFISLVAALGAGLLLASPSAAAPPASTSVQIDPQATFVSPSTIVITIGVECPSGTAALLNGSISQPQVSGPNTTGLGGAISIVCDGRKQTVSMTINGGPFTLGQAFAAVTVQNTQLLGTAQDSRVIKIS